MADGRLVLALMLAALPTAAQEADVDAEFLEYLGSWDSSDEEWVMFGPADTDEADGGDEARAAEADDEDGTKEPDHDS